MFTVVGESPDLLECFFKVLAPFICPTTHLGGKSTGGGGRGAGIRIPPEMICDFLM